MKWWEKIKEAVKNAAINIGMNSPEMQAYTMYKYGETEDLLEQIEGNISFAEGDALRKRISSARTSQELFDELEAVNQQAISLGAQMKATPSRISAAKDALRKATRIDDDSYLGQFPNLTVADVRSLREALDDAKTWDEIRQVGSKINLAVGRGTTAPPTGASQDDASIFEFTGNDLTSGTREESGFGTQTEQINRILGADWKNGKIIPLADESEFELQSYDAATGAYKSLGIYQQQDNGQVIKIRDSAFPDPSKTRWGTYTDETGTWQYDTDNPQGERFKIADVQQQFTFQERLNPSTGQYETFRVDETGRIVGDSLGASYNVFSGERGFGEDVRQFNVSDARLRDQFNRSFGEDQRQFNLGYGLDRDRFGEDIRQFDTSFGETQRQFDTTEGRMERTLAANNYFNSLEELGRNYRTFIQTAPQMANAATNQGQLVADILRSGGDVLARTYFTRGGISPLPEITQADLINNLNSEMAKIQQFEVDATTAENRRRAAADLQRSQEEYTQFKSARQRDAERAYDQYKAGQRPYEVSSQVSAPNVGEFQRARDDYRENQGTADQLSVMAKSFAELPQFVIDQQFGGLDRQSLADMANEAAGAVRAGGAAGAVDQGAMSTLGLQYTGPQQSEFMDTQTVSETVTPQVKEYSDWLTTSQFGGPQMGFDQWSTQVGPSFAPTPLLNVPDVPMPRPTTQAELIAQSRATTPPAVASVLSGQMPTPLQFGGLPLPTFQQLQALTPTEQQMLNTRLMTEFNVPLEDVAFQSQRQFGAPSMERNRDLARFRGYAV